MPYPDTSLLLVFLLVLSGGFICARFVFPVLSSMAKKGTELLCKNIASIVSVRFSRTSHEVFAEALKAPPPAPRPPECCMYVVDKIRYTQRVVKIPKLADRVV